MDAIGLRHRENFYRMYLLPAIDLGLIEYTIPGKPNSRLQKYRLTDKGRAALAAMRKTKAAMQATARPAPPSGRL